VVGIIQQILATTLVVVAGFFAFGGYTTGESNGDMVIEACHSHW
jgi:hypothetical protein